VSHLISVGQNGYPLRVLSAVIFCVLNIPAAKAADYFSPDLIEMRGNIARDIDISRFSQAGGQSPGSWQVTVALNNQQVDEREIRFERVDEALSPVLTKADLLHWGVEANALPEFMAMRDDEQINELSTLLPGSYARLDFEAQRLEISIPQQYMQRNPQGTVPASEWDDGLNALFLNYSYSGATGSNENGSTNSQYANLRSGINLGPWRLRNYSTWNDGDRGSHWNSISTSLQRDIKALRSQFAVGDSYTSSEVFDSFGFRGVQLYSDDGMLPESQRGFAPVIRGIAQSNAQVTIRQNGNIIWQSYVPPGPFAIDDLYPTSSSGDLQVSIREADGTVRQFTQAFSAVPIMRREGQYSYALTAGKYRTSSDSDKEPNFLQLTGSYGLPWTTTLYGGAIASEEYFSGALGIGKSFGDWGSLSFDATWAHSQLPDGSKDDGVSLRAQYSKDIAWSGTHFTLMGYRYSTEGFHDFQEANGEQNWQHRQNKRSKAQIDINQQVGDWGNINLSLYQQEYWGGDKEQTVNFGYNTSIDAINYGLNYSYSRQPWYGNGDHVVSFTVQVPLSRFLPNSWLHMSASSNKKGDVASSAGLSGVALADNNLSWNVQQGYDSRGGKVSGSASADYKASFGEYQLGYNYSRHQHQTTVGAMGGVVVHPYGVSLSQPLGETMALVKADDASKVKVSNNTGIYTDNKGFAVIPSVTPYRRNSLTLDSSSLNSRTDILNDTTTVVPTKGALALAEYPTVTGYKAMFHLQGATIPFGATVSVKNGSVTTESIVDDRQRVWLSGVPEKGTLSVRWENGSCQAAYQINNPSDGQATVTAQCR